MKIKKLFFDYGLKVFILYCFLSFVFVSKAVATSCCTRTDCGGTTCAGANCSIYPKQYGQCTGGGTECGFGVGSACPSGYTCNNGNCVQNCVPGGTSCGGCSVSCGGGTKTCSDGCSSWNTSCNTQSCCTAGPAPTLNTPTVGEEVVSPVDFSWNGVTWGVESAAGSRTYTICTGTNASDPCTGGQIFSVTGTTPATSYSASGVTPGDQYWAVKATNSCGQTSALSEIRNVCVEGFDVNNTAYVSNWTVCDANHTHTRTCTEDCGTDDCAGVALSESCEGEVTGTIFNASDYGSCPAFDPATGYLVGLPANLGAPSRSFGFADQSNVAPHPWSLLTPATTDANGNYSIRTYAPATYEYDFSSLSDIYVTSGGPKLTCLASTATVPSNPVTCKTQPCSPVYGMSFGFWRVYGGWWQVMGGSVHANGGIKSEIPSSLLTEMSLILPDASMGNKRGFLSYGETRPADMLGDNPNAKVSASLWEKESRYSGANYDWSFYNSRFKNFATTAFTDGDIVNYNDQGVGYQIFKSNGSLTNFDYNPVGAEKAIFIVNGDVRVTGDIVVPDGAFLAIIAKGTITFDQSVNQADGWYVAGNIALPCTDTDGNGCDKTDVRFLGNGSFIGWNGFSLGRTRGLTNNTESTELFTYRQDLFQNAPKPMKIYTKYYKPFVP